MLFKDNYKIHTTVQATAIVNFKCLPELIQLLKTVTNEVYLLSEVCLRVAVLKCCCNDPRTQTSLISH